MGYAELGDVKARAGKLQAAWGVATVPNDSQIGEFLTNVAAEIDAIIGARGFTVPLADGSAAANALLGLNADGALILALDATFPGKDGPGGVGDLRARVEKRYCEGMDALRDGTHPAIVLLESSGEATSAGSLWTDDPDYGLGAPPTLNPHLAPNFHRAQKL